MITVLHSDTLIIGREVDNSVRATLVIGRGDDNSVRVTH